MCINPSFVWVQRGPKHERQPVACRQCWRCKQNRQNDYIARCMAEAAYSQVSCVVNLTYAPRDDLADKILLPRHFQLFIKRLRNAGHKVRYLVAGEYGSLKSRAHYHAILFFQELRPLVYKQKNGRIVQRGMVPRYLDDYPEGFGPYDGSFCREIPQGRMVHCREWGEGGKDDFRCHGHMTVDWDITEKSIRYVTKYLLSEDKKNAWFAFSKEPALGARFFAEKAAFMKALGVAPSSFEYLPPGGNKKRPYMMTGATRRDFLKAVMPEDPDPNRFSEWVQKSYEKFKRQEWVKALEGVPLDEALAAWEERRRDETERADILSRFHSRRDEDLIAQHLDNGDHLQLDTDGNIWIEQEYDRWRQEPDEAKAKALGLRPLVRKRK